MSTSTFITASLRRLPPLGARRGFHSSRSIRQQYLNASPSTFNSAVLKPSDPSRLVLVDFYADWCGPCRTLSPVLENITSDKTKTDGQEVDLVTIDTDAHQELASTYQVNALPFVVAFKGGKPLSHFVGAIPKPQLEKAVAQWLKAPTPS